jgi:hypothetical protein
LLQGPASPIHGGVSEEGERKALRAIVIASVLLHAVTAWTSLGYHQLDEHFQILEMLSYHLGHTPREGLPVDFGQQVRPFFAIAPMYVIARGVEVFSDSPIVLERVLRFVAACLGFATTLALAARLRSEVKTPRARLFGTAFLLLYWPFLYTHARLSAEPWGSNAFYAALLLLPRQHDRAPARAALRELGAGLLLGAAFHLRYHLGVAMVGAFALWVLERRSLAFFGRVALGFALTFALGVLADRWGYGTWALPAWNYFQSQIIRRDVELAGVSPWWWYFSEITLTLVPPFGALLIGLVGWFGYRNPRHPFVLPGALFFLVHVGIPHKEQRFLTPLLPLVPWSIAYALDAFDRERSRPQSGRDTIVSARLAGHSGSAWLRRTVTAYAIVSAVVAPAMLLRRANFPQYYFEYVDAHYWHRGYDVVWHGRPPMQLADLPVYYYRPSRYTETELSTLQDLPLVLATRRREVLLFEASFEAPRVITEHCHLLVRTLPDFMYRPEIAAAVDPTVRWSLYACQGERETGYAALE